MSFAHPHVEESVVKVLVGYFSTARGKITADSRLVEDLFVDSISLVEVVMLLNETFSVEIPQEEVAQWKAVEDITRSVMSCDSTGSFRE